MKILVLTFPNHVSAAEEEAMRSTIRETLGVPAEDLQVLIVDGASSSVAFDVETPADRKKMALAYREANGFPLHDPDDDL